MIRVSVGGAILALGLASSALGYGHLESGLGSGVSQGSARGSGMGETGLVSDTSPVALAGNPALLAGPEVKHFALAYRFASMDETWAFPVHDSFDAVLGYNTYAATSEIYSDLTGGLATGGISWARGACVGVALVPAYDFRYDFREEIRDRNSSSQPPDLLIANNFVEATGEIRSFSAGLGMPVLGGLDIGVGLDYLFGEREVKSGVIFADLTKMPWEGESPESSETFSATGLAGTRFTAGLNLALGRRVAVGASLKTKCDLDGNLDLTSIVPQDTVIRSDITLECPPVYSFGLSFRPRNELPTVIEGNVVFVGWSEVEDAANPGVSLDDVYEWHIGVEHVFYNSRPLRFGFLLRPSPSDKETSESAVTAGTGLRFGGLDIDIAAKVGWREYRAADLFSDDIFGAEARQSTDLVKETVIGGSVSVSKRF